MIFPRKSVLLVDIIVRKSLPDFYKLKARGGSLGGKISFLHSFGSRWDSRKWINR